jgi:hypothetical protein
MYIPYPEFTSCRAWGNVQVCPTERPDPSDKITLSLSDDPVHQPRIVSTSGILRQQPPGRTEGTSGPASPYEAKQNTSVPFHGDRTFSSSIPLYSEPFPGTKFNNQTAVSFAEYAPALERLPSGPRDHSGVTAAMPKQPSSVPGSMLYCPDCRSPATGYIRRKGSQPAN